MTTERLRNEVLQFYGVDPVVAWLLTVALLFVIALLIKVAIDGYQARQERRRDEQFMQTMRAHLAAPDPINYPPPVGPKGFAKDAKHRRVG